MQCFSANMSINLRHTKLLHVNAHKTNTTTINTGDRVTDYIQTKTHTQGIAVTISANAHTQSL